ncbi:unnamed protein product [Lepeophtheirus salmonis]|uniref:(salmon louse) hypothetical protein n=1 Tax=Lepeophtheirus salmonis TaxID=72036 RepID=A0A7R8H8W2_LEPSM|nr:unnamed protein product [Lepeophtheirus salmonis]CAF2945236.1 unnamed protein product [Lepeophtheirus salmonis]
MLHNLLFGLALISVVSGAIRSYDGGPPPPPYAYSYDSPPKYNFRWNVNDPYSGNNFQHNEQRENDVTSGSYSVQLPDGRLQKVTYSVSGEGGYQAEVTYEGIASNEYYTSESTNPKPIKVIKTIPDSSSSYSQRATISNKPSASSSSFSSPSSFPQRATISNQPSPTFSSFSSPSSSGSIHPLDTVVVTNPLPLGTSASSISISTTPAPSLKKYTYKIKADKLKRDVHFPKLFHF